MICPWCSGTGCGSCHGNGETRVSFRWTCPQCGASGTEDENAEERERCACGGKFEYAEITTDPEDAFDPPDHDYEEAIE